MNSTAVYKDDLEIFFKEIRESLQKAEDENSLLAVADKISGIDGLGESIHRYEKEQEIIRRIYDCQKSASQLETLFISLVENYG